MTAEPESFDFINKVVVLRDRIGKYRDAPAATASNTVMRDAWTEILGPKAGIVFNVLKRLAGASRWVFLDDDEKADLLDPSLWPQVLDEISSLYTDLAPCVPAYGRAQGEIVVRASITLGIQFNVSKPSVGSKAEIAAAKKAATDKAVAAQAAAESAASEVVKAAKAELAAVQADLAGLMTDVRGLVAAMQLAEERRLRSRVDALPNDTQDRKTCESALHAMLIGRIDGLNFYDKDAANYWLLVNREWMKPRKVVISKAKP